MRTRPEQEFKEIVAVHGMIAGAVVAFFSAIAVFNLIASAVIA